MGFVFHVSLTHSPNRSISSQLLITKFSFGAEEIQRWFCQVSDNEVRAQRKGKGWGAAALSITEEPFLTSEIKWLRYRREAPSEGGFCTHPGWLEFFLPPQG